MNDETETRAPAFSLTIDGDPPGDLTTYWPGDGDPVRIGITDMDHENGYPITPGDSLSWCIGAAVTFDPAEDRVTFSITTGDPRGAFVFAVFRSPDGSVFLHSPTPGDGLLHEELETIREGTYRIARTTPDAGGVEA